MSTLHPNALTVNLHYNTFVNEIDFFRRLHNLSMEELVDRTGIPAAKLTSIAMGYLDEADLSILSKVFRVKLQWEDKQLEPTRPSHVRFVFEVAEAQKEQAQQILDRVRTELAGAGITHQMWWEHK